MTLRPSLAACLALLVLLAGCGGPQSPRSTTTPPPTTVGRHTTSPPDPGHVLPPGVDEAGLTDPESLLAAHYATLNATSYRMRYDAGLISTDGLAASSALVREGANARYVRVNESGVTTEVFTTGVGAYVRTARDGDASLGYYRGDDTEAFYATQARLVVERSVLRPYLVAGDFDLAGTVTRDGRTLVRLRATSADGDRLPANVTFEHFDVTVLVTRGGVVREVSGGVSQRVGGEVRSGEFVYRVDHVGAVSVERPDWVVDRFPKVHVSVDDDAVRLIHLGGPNVRNGSTVVLETGDGTARRSLRSPFVVGDALFASLSASGGTYDLRLSRLPPSGARVPLDGRVVVVVHTADGVTLRYVVGPAGE